MSGVWMRESRSGGSFARYHVQEGDTFGQLTAERSLDARDCHGSMYWLFRCSCGGQRIAVGSRIVAAARRGRNRIRCKECHARNKREALRYRFMAQYQAHGTLWTARQIDQLQIDVAADLDDAFGTLYAEDVQMPVSMDAGYRDDVNDTERTVALRKKHVRRAPSAIANARRARERQELLPPAE